MLLYKNHHGLITRQTFMDLNDNNIKYKTEDFLK